MAVAGGEMQRRVAIVFRAVHVHAVVNERPDDLWLVLLGRKHEGREAALGLVLGVRAHLQQVADCLIVPLSHRQIQRRAAELVLVVNGRFRQREPAQHRDVAAPSGVVHGIPPSGSFAHGGVGAGLKQRVHGRNGPSKRRCHQRRGPGSFEAAAEASLVGVVPVHRFRPLREMLLQLRHGPAQRRFEDELSARHRWLLRRNPHQI
mmetsp:Transcript_19349/g.73094  ORF Transcript_19349/g.73094 Transcript_19349/m.73094 type:complete len:205 (-) Transcript_19349:362-976(-)